MQFDQQSDGEQIPLPRPSIDTGAGLERVLSVMQNVDAVWELDEFQTLLEAAEAITGVAKDSEKSTLVSLQILVDHARSSSFLISDGVIPVTKIEDTFCVESSGALSAMHIYLGWKSPLCLS